MRNTSWQSGVGRATLGGVQPESAERGPETMRRIVQDYVRMLHATYLDHLRHLPPGERAALPLVNAGSITVVAAAARRLHLIAIDGRLPAPTGTEVELADDYGGTRWWLRFYDPSVLPQLGLPGEDTPAEVQRILGISAVLYHLTVPPGGGLDGHHAQHSGVALANAHTRVGRDLDRLRTALPHRASAVDEFGVCVRIGLDRAAALLAYELTGGRVTPDEGTPAARCLDAVIAAVVPA